MNSDNCQYAKPYIEDGIVMETSCTHPRARIDTRFCYKGTCPMTNLFNSDCENLTTYAKTEEIKHCNMNGLLCCIDTCPKLTFNDKILALLQTDNLTNIESAASLIVADKDNNNHTSLEYEMARCILNLINGGDDLQSLIKE